MNKWIPAGVSLLMVAHLAFAQPPSPDGLALWLRADAGVVRDAQGRVSLWQDQSGKGNDFAEADPELQPLLIEPAAAGRPALRFDGADDSLTLAQPLPVAGRTVFAVVKWNAMRTYSFALGCAEGTDGYLRMHNATSLLTGGRYPVLYQNGIPFPKVGRTPQESGKPFHMGVASLLDWNIYAIPETAAATERLKHLGQNELNNTTGNRFLGEIAEILVYDSVLAAAARAAVEQYLGAKYLAWPPATRVPVQEVPLPVAAEVAAADKPADGDARILAHGVTDKALPPGRYRVRFGLFGAAGLSNLTVRLGGAVQVVAMRPDAAAPADLSADFVIPVGQLAEAALVRVSREGGASGRVTVRNLQVMPLAPVIVSDAQVGKILYAPGEAATAVITVRNFSAEAHRVQVRVSEVTGLDDRRPLGTLAADVPANGDVTLTLAFQAGMIEYGRDLLVEVLQEGRLLDVRREPYSVARNLWQVAIGSPNGGPIAQTAPYNLETIAGQLRDARKNYCNWFEKSFWAPDDWGLMVTEPGTTWFSGQARRHENTEKLQFQIKTAHELGMKAITYGKCMAGGVPGWELARRRPQWFSTDAYGRTMGRPADVWDLDHWQQADTYKYTDYKYVWTYRWVDLRRLDALDHGIDQLIASTRQFGWDGVRYDSGGFRAHFVAKDGQVLYDGVDSINARNMRRTKERLWEVFPDFLFGYNTNDPTQEKGAGVSPLLPADPAGHEFREMLAGGGLWMFEGMRDAPEFWGRRTYKTWSDYATDMVQAIRTIKGYGGHVCFSYGDTTLYKYMIGTMIGAHDYVGEHQRAKGSEHWGRFLTRWSSFVWDHRLRALPNEDALTVSSARPLWWQGFANELVTGPTRRSVIVHLMNPPVNDACAKTQDETPEPVAGVRLSFAHAGEKLAKAFFIAPGTPNRAVPLTRDSGHGASASIEAAPSPLSDAFSRGGGAASTTRAPLAATPGVPEPLSARPDDPGLSSFDLPRLDIWAMVVLELEGAYVPPRLPPPLSEPLSAAELAELEPCKPTPNVPVADSLPNPAPQFDPDKVRVKDFGAAKVTAPAGLLPGGGPETDVLVVQGFYHAAYGVPEAIKEQAPEARVTTCTTRDLPQDYPSLYRYDVVVLVNMGAEAWNADGHQRLADYVDAGGRLVVLGGPFTLGQGFFAGTALEGILPVEVRQARDVYQLPAPLPLGPKPNAAFKGSPLLYFFHAVRPKADARVSLWAGELPLCFERTVNRGTACVFAGTPLGEAETGDQQPFWTWDGWPRVLRDIVFGAKR